MHVGVERGRRPQGELTIGICGEHGGDPASVRFCHELGLDYVSCSPYRVPVAGLLRRRRCWPSAAPAGTWWPAAGVAAASPGCGSLAAAGAILPQHQLRACVSLQGRAEAHCAPRVPENRETGLGARDRPACRRCPRGVGRGGRTHSRTSPEAPAARKHDDRVRRRDLDAFTTGTTSSSSTSAEPAARTHSRARRRGGGDVLGATSRRPVGARRGPDAVRHGGRGDDLEAVR